jgi:predicted MFS family arabinose efflux permease
MTLAMIFCVLYALALPLETLVIPLIVNDLFGSVSYEKMLGIFSAVNYIGYAVGSPVINLTYDVFGSYKYALWVCAGIMLCGCIAIRFVLGEVVKIRQQQTMEEISK